MDEMLGRQGLMRAALIVVAGLVLLVPLVLLLVRALSGERLVAVSAFPVHVEAHDARLWLALAVAGGLASLTGWGLAEHARARLEDLSRDLRAAEEEAREAQRRAEERTEQAEERAEQAEERLQRTEQRAEQAEERLQRTEQRLQRADRERQQQRAQHEQFARAWKAQREWNRQLREQVSQLQVRQGILGRMDVHDLVLQLTVELTEAEKGILLSRHEGADGELALVSSVGFEHDPADSALARRFAQEVIERDTPIREDRENEVNAEKRTPADEEVHNLLAIPIYMHDDFHGVIVCANHEGGFHRLDDDVLVAVGDHAGAVLQNSRLHGELRSAYLQTVKTLSSVIEVKDPDLRGHSEAVAEYVMRVADRLGFEPRQREELVFAALLHDVGKIGISERILLKPAALTDEEFSVMQLHPRIGYHLIRQIPALEPVAPAILHHHERFDGRGYPGRLRGEMIPLQARIIAVSDAFSAMITERPYRSPMGIEEACAELERCAGDQFDPEVVRVFVEEVRRRPPDQITPDPAPPDPELEIHRQEGSYVLGAGAFGIVDSLTQLYSHRHFYETALAEAQRAALQGRPFGIIIAQLHELPQINRAEGFAAGDAALQRVGDAFRRAAARVGATACRVSGCRIGLITPGLDDQGTTRVAEALCEELRGGPAGSVGVAAWQPGESGEQVVERALRAALQAEAAGAA